MFVRKFSLQETFFGGYLSNLAATYLVCGRREFKIIGRKVFMLDSAGAAAITRIVWPRQAEE